MKMHVGVLKMDLATGTYWAAIGINGKIVEIKTPVRIQVTVI